MHARSLGALGLALGATLVVSVLACGPGALICTGGARNTGTGCFCALGTTWNGQICEGTPQAGTCTQAGAMQVGELCFCPDGYNWTDTSMTACAALNCQGGSFVSVNECVCPNGLAWIENQCQAPCVPGAIRVDAMTCQCPEGTVNQGDVFGCQAPPIAGPIDQPGPVQPPPQTFEDLCYDLDCNGSRTGKQCFKSRAEYCASLCASDNCLAPQACQRNCR